MRRDDRCLPRTQLDAGEAVVALGCALSGRESAACLASPVGQVLTSPHPVGRIIGQVPLVVLIVDDRAFTRRGSRVRLEAEIRRVGRRFRPRNILPGREVRGGMLVARPDRDDAQGSDGEVPMPIPGTYAKVLATRPAMRVT